MTNCLNIFSDRENFFTRKSKKFTGEKKKNGYSLITDNSGKISSMEFMEFEGKYWTRKTFLQMAKYSLLVYQSFDDNMISKETRDQVIKLLNLGINDAQYMYVTLVGLKRYHLNKEKTQIIFE
ncbi:hypothetical protein ma621 [Moumouvirus australiensis]|uniref:Uncharacterized protein n=1 Tax=Moumouvirus australiensis TaxID=2109587 RepID=A0A2P1EM80_9VIRU|nr:hypothetical protein QKC55_gp284 [Moumouvirus australiensis]AVL95007.1 hypothetical protein ma621 [Moumouvirus australiensis]